MNPAAGPASAVVLVRPRHFRPNEATTVDNAFQAVSARPAAEVAAAAHEEVTTLAAALRRHGVDVLVFDDEDPTRPDAVFPNNWLTTHPDGRIALHAMRCENRRSERRPDIVEVLKARYDVQAVVDYSAWEHAGFALEGTGAMVLDHRAGVAYVGRSDRVDGVVLDRFCADFGFTPFAFDTADERGRAVYHTNVMLCLGQDVALLAPDLVASASERRALVASLQDGGREVVALGVDQVRDFAANALELQGRRERLMAMSARAAASLTAGQRAAIERHCRIVAVPVPTIELAGGSVRCMLAEVHLRPRAIRSADAPSGVPAAA